MSADQPAQLPAAGVVGLLACQERTRRRPLSWQRKPGSGWHLPSQLPVAGVVGLLACQERTRCRPLSWQRKPGSGCHLPSDLSSEEHSMSLQVHWFLPTSGDSRNVVGAGLRSYDDDAPPGPFRTPDIDYLAQVARAAEQLGF